MLHRLTIKILALIVSCVFATGTVAQTSHLIGSANRIGDVRDHLSAGRFTSALPLLESLVSDSSDHVEALWLLLQLRQDTYLRSKRAAVDLANQLRDLPLRQLVLNERSIEDELQLRFLQLTTSPMKAMSFFGNVSGKGRRGTTSAILASDMNSALALNERALESFLLDDLQKAEHWARSAMGSDPRSQTAYLMLFRIALESGDWSSVDSLSNVMRTMMPENPYGWSIAGYAAFRRNDFESAEVLFQSSLERMPYALRRAYIDATPYFREDVAGELAMDSVAFSINYWTINDPMYLSEANERRIEHFARLTASDLLFSDVYSDQYGWETERGQFMVRYGAPDIIGRETRLETDESEFDDDVDRGRRPALRSVESRWNIAANMTPGGQTISNAKTPDRFETWVYGRERYRFYDTWWTGSFVLYSPSAIAFSHNRRLRDDAIEAKNLFAREPFRSTIRIPGARIPLTFLVTRMQTLQELGTETDPGTMDVVVARGIPVQSPPRRGNLNTSLASGSFVTGLEDGMVARNVETFDFLESNSILSINNQMFWVHPNTLQVPAGNSYTLSIEYQSLPERARYDVRRLNIEPFEASAGSLNISDLLLCYAVDEIPDTEDEMAQGLLRRYGYQLFPAPDNLFAPDEAIYVYFEVYNLSHEQGARLRFSIEAVLVEADGKRNDRNVFSWLSRQDHTPAVSVSFKEEHEPGVVPYYILLDTHGLSPGEYDLALRITDNSNGQATLTSRPIILQ